MYVICRPLNDSIHTRFQAVQFFVFPIQGQRSRRFWTHSFLVSSSAPPGRSVHRPRCFGACQPPLWNWRTLFLWDTQVPFGMIWHVPCLPHVFFGNKGGAASDHSDRLYQIGRLFHDDMVRYYLDIRIRPRNEAQNYTELRTNWRVKLVHKTVPKLKNSTHHTERQSEQLQYWECDACRRA